MIINDNDKSVTFTQKEFLALYVYARLGLKAAEIAGVLTLISLRDPTFYNFVKSALPFCLLGLDKDLWQRLKEDDPSVVDLDNLAKCALAFRFLLTKAAEGVDIVGLIKEVVNDSEH